MAEMVDMVYSQLSGKASHKNNAGKGLYRDFSNIYTLPLSPPSLKIVRLYQRVIAQQAKAGMVTINSRTPLFFHVLTSLTPPERHSIQQKNSGLKDDWRE
jgi:hypothetical protein